MVLQMAKELDAILDHGEADSAASCKTDTGSVSYLEQITCSIYETIAAVSGNSNIINSNVTLCFFC